MIKMKNNFIKNFDKNLPNALMIMGIAGVFVTTYCAVEATFKAVEHIQEAKKVKEAETGESKLQPKEIVQACAKDYAKTAVALTATVACTACAYSEEARKATLATVAYRTTLDVLADKERFQEKLEAAVGPKKTKQLKEEYDIEKAQQYQSEPIEHSSVKARTGDELVVIIDVAQGRQFWSTVNNVKDAFSNFRASAITELTEDSFGYMDELRDTFRKPWNDLNAELGIEFSEIGHVMGYSFKEIQNLNPRLTPSQTSDGKLCWALSYNTPMSFA